MLFRDLLMQTTITPTVDPIAFIHPSNMLITSLSPHSSLYEPLNPSKNSK